MNFVLILEDIVTLTRTHLNFPMRNPYEGVQHITGTNQALGRAIDGTSPLFTNP